MAKVAAAVYRNVAEPHASAMGGANVRMAHRSGRITFMDIPPISPGERSVSDVAVVSGGGDDESESTARSQPRPDSARAVRSAWISAPRR